MTETLTPKQLSVVETSISTLDQASPAKFAIHSASTHPTFLLGIGTAVPQHSATQDEARDFMLRVLTASAEAPGSSASPPLGLLKRIYAHSGIERRHSVVGDYMKQDPAEFIFYPKNWALQPSPTTAARMAQFEASAVDLAADAARRALDTAGVAASEVTHIVISTCTGFFAPGLDVLLLRRLGMATTTARSVLGFMGCYAGVSGIRASHQIVQSDPDAVVLQVSIELCSLHYQTDSSPDTIVANSIFADGAAAAVYGSNSVVRGDSAAPAARVIAAHSDVSANSLDRMSWRIGDHGFIMTLDAGIPDILRAEAPAFVDALAAAGDLVPADIAGWAVHPGGRKIVESIQQALDLTSDDVESSFSVLRDYGNMSSATILFVLQRELERGLSTGSPIAAMAFGPGLTMEGALLEAQ